VVVSFPKTTKPTNTYQCLFHPYSQQLLTSSSIETNNPPPHLAPQKSIEIRLISSKKEEETKPTQPWKRETNQ